MTTESISLELSHREVTGKKVKQLRSEGMIPVSYTHLTLPTILLV